jgi:hypothetical protein
VRAFIAAVAVTIGTDGIDCCSNCGENPGVVIPYGSCRICGGGS